MPNSLRYWQWQCHQPLVLDLNAWCTLQTTHNFNGHHQLHFTGNSLSQYLYFTMNINYSWLCVLKGSMNYCYWHFFKFHVISFSPLFWSLFIHIKPHTTLQYYTHSCSSGGPDIAWRRRRIKLILKNLGCNDVDWMSYSTSCFHSDHSLDLMKVQYVHVSDVGLVMQWSVCNKP